MGHDSIVEEVRDNRVAHEANDDDAPVRERTGRSRRLHLSSEPGLPLATSPRWNINHRNLTSSLMR